ncbi:hypothetical protein D6T64_10355 [Cryobacterium melibiosiphilum]|uniref:Uncharacterized protein n=1 Tax=Cryobacterium melibiosiphilum TaxID=995039 RepID=A0A3A5MGH5_9MICO|nr:hypothetical protein [Cryobacterium melibiosiphilum]RJT88522.1 hypothetical protein D6T64_10355 [Cryobacterium melibiosiphilum]
MNHHSGRTEQGSSLLAVIGVMAVFAIISITIVASTMTTLGATTSTRASVQAQAAAEAGIDATVARFATTSCPELTSASPDVTFTVALAFQVAGEEDWHEGCPSSAAIAVRITSTGNAVNDGVLGNTGGDARTVQAIYSAEATTAEISPDVAVHAESTIGFGDSSQVFYATGASRPSLYVKDGDVKCTGSSIMRMDLVIPHGSFSMGGSCQFFGDVWSAGDAKLAGSAILTGSLIAPSIDTVGSSIITGDAWALNEITMKGSSQIKGNVVAASVDHKETSQIGGTKTLSPASSRIFPVFPDAPLWQDFSYEKYDWSDYVQKTASGTCTFAELQPIVDSLQASRGLIDARACTNGITSIGDEILTLKNDLVIITNNVDLQGSAQFQAVSSGAKLWLIMPDEVADGAPTCPVNARANIQNSFIAGTHVQALLYSPCDITFTYSAIWYGQMYGATVTFGGSAILNHVGMTFPTVTAVTGPGSASPGTFTLGIRDSIRDLD